MLTGAEIQEDNPLVCCFVDGDGTVFAKDYWAAGQHGGRQAAMAFHKGINEYLDGERGNNMPPSARVQLLTAVYFNKVGLQQTLVSHGVCTHKQFEGFLLGFNQATPLCTMVDVGPGKEAADHKIKGT